MSGDLVAFLRARLDEDEQTARAAIYDNTTGEWHVQAEEGYLHEAVTDKTRVRMATGPRAVNTFIARHDPARVLREVEAKRQIIAGCLETLAEEDSWDPRVDGGRGGEFGMCRWVLRLLAQPDVDHPDYRDEWRSSRKVQGQ